jgi:hypothetical protein
LPERRGWSPLCIIGIDGVHMRWLSQQRRTGTLLEPNCMHVIDTHHA